MSAGWLGVGRCAACGVTGSFTSAVASRKAVPAAAGVFVRGGSGRSEGPGATSIGVPPRPEPFILSGSQAAIGPIFIAGRPRRSSRSPRNRRGNPASAVRILARPIA